LRTMKKLDSTLSSNSPRMSQGSDQCAIVDSSSKDSAPSFLLQSRNVRKCQLAYGHITPWERHITQVIVLVHLALKGAAVTMPLESNKKGIFSSLRSILTINLTITPSITLMRSCI